ncbi:MAG: hypothetical protein WKF74_01740 [Pyrinomonadaceae bacterium]|jgi:hypothetical protein
MTDDDVYSEEESDDDAFFDELPDDALFTSVWLLTGITGSVFGHLTFANGRIAFTTNDGCVFNVPLSEVSDVEFPWYYFDVSVKFRIGAERYRLSFAKPGNTGGRLSDVFEGRQSGKAWKSVLTART